MIPIIAVDHALQGIAMIMEEESAEMLSDKAETHQEAEEMLEGMALRRALINACGELALHDKNS